MNNNEPDQRHGHNMYCCNLRIVKTVAKYRQIPKLTNKTGNPDIIHDINKYKLCKIQVELMYFLVKKALITKHLVRDNQLCQIDDRETPNRKLPQRVSAKLL